MVVQQFCDLKTGKTTAVSLTNPQVVTNARILKMKPVTFCTNAIALGIDPEEQLSRGDISNILLLKSIRKSVVIYTTLFLTCDNYFTTMYQPNQ